MKKAGKIIAFLVIIPLLLVPLAACGTFGAGIEAAQLVVCDTDLFAICGATTCDTLFLFGSGFPPDECVRITICDTNYVLCELSINDCGAFICEIEPLIMALDAEQYSYLCDNYDHSTVSVRAWLTCTVKEGKVVYGELWASWPLYLSCPETCPE